MSLQGQLVPRFGVTAIFLPGLMLMLLCAATAAAAGQPAAAAIASSSRLVTEAGRGVIESGGNAIDAAVAMTAVLAVTEPQVSGLGGGGVWLLYRAGDQAQVVVDGLATVPELAHPSMFQGQTANSPDSKPARGVITAGIPGVPAALVHLSASYGRLPLSACLEPAIRYAEKGIIFTPDMQVRDRQYRQILSEHQGLKSLYLDGDKKVKQPELATTLRSLAVQGRAGFYEGELAQAMVNEVNRQGGIWTRQDLAGYRVREQTPLLTSYHDMQVVTTPLPSAGGVVLAQSLGILSHFQLQEMHGSQRTHMVIEALRRAYRDRWVYAGASEDSMTRRLTDAAYLEGLALTLEPGRATPSDTIGDTPGVVHVGTQSTHFSIIDFEGNRVAATLSLGSSFGSGHRLGSAGILLNNELGNLALMTSRKVPGDPVFVPGARLLTNMTPVFLQSGDRLAILGTPGGDRIASILVQAALAFYEGRDLTAWMQAPRYHHQYLPDVIEFEHDGLTFAEQRQLFDMGHKLQEVEVSFGSVQAIIWNKGSNRVNAITDQRGKGSAVVFKR